MEQRVYRTKTTTLYVGSYFEPAARVEGVCVILQPITLADMTAQHLVPLASLEIFRYQQHFC